jgi:outer membrane protein OmpA-like peptidoglycan-associated protein
MNLRNIAIATSLMLGTAAVATAGNIVDSFGNTWSSITNKDDTWGPQDRTGQWYLGVDANGFANAGNAKAGATGGWNGIVGYNINKYFAVQYNQFATYGGMFGGLGEGVINLSNSTMVTPYAAGGAGWANLAGQATGAWDVGGGLKFEMSRDVQLTADYRYIQTMAPQPIAGGGQQPNARSGTNMIGGGVTWFFGGDDSGVKTNNIKDTGAMTAAEVDDKYKLPSGIKQCEANFNLTEDGVACYTINGDDVTVYLDTKFAYNSAELNTKGKTAISSFVTFINDNDIEKVTVKGYASKGSEGNAYENYNKELSEKRAQSVSDYMHEQGLDDTKVSLEAFGYEFPLVPNTTSENKRYNQRVQAAVSAPLKA